MKKKLIALTLAMTALTMAAGPKTTPCAPVTS